MWKNDDNDNFRTFRSIELCMDTVESPREIALDSVDKKEKTVGYDVTIFQFLKPAQKQLTTGGGFCNYKTLSSQ